MAYQKTHHDRGYHDPDYKNKKRNDKIKEETQRKIQYDKDCTKLIAQLEQLNNCRICDCFRKFLDYAPSIYTCTKCVK